MLSRTSLAGRSARNLAALILFSRTVITTLAIVCCIFGFLTGIEMQRASFDPYAFADRCLAALFAAACDDIPR